MANLPTRQQNPGDLKDPTTGVIRTFNSAAEGQAALYNDLTAKMTGTSSTGIGPSSTLYDFASVYAPKSDGNNPAQYAANLANQLHVSPDTQIGTLTSRIDDFAKAVSHNEGYQPTDTPSVQQNGLGSFTPQQSDSQITPDTTQQYQPQQRQQTTDGQGGGFLNGAIGVLNSIEAPFVGLGALPVQALAKLTGHADPYAQGIPGFNGSKVGVSDLGVEQKLGDAAQVGSYFVPGSGIASGIGMGALQGAGGAMSQGGSLADVAGQGALGGVVGGAATGATKLIGKGLGALGDLASGEGVSKATQAIKDAYSSALNLHQNERAFETRSGKDLAKVLMDNSAALGRNADGTLDATTAIEKLQSVLNPLNEQAKQIISQPELSNNVSSAIPLAQWRDGLIAKIQKAGLDPVSEETAIENANKLYEASQRKYGDLLSPQIAEDLKQSLANNAFRKALSTSDQLQNNVNYLGSNELRKNIEQAVAGSPAGDVYGKLNAQRSDLIDAIKRLSKLDGSRLLKGGKLGNMAGGLTGTIIGSGFGPLGSLAGDYFGTKAAEFLNNPATKINMAQSQKKVAGFLPNLLGGTAKTVGGAVSKTGQTIDRKARLSGLLANLLVRNKTGQPSPKSP